VKSELRDAQERNAIGALPGWLILRHPTAGLHIAEVMALCGW